MVFCPFSAAVKKTSVQANKLRWRKFLIHNFYSSRQKKNLMKQVKHTAEAFLAKTNSRA
jgi:hypothetical protein